MKRKISNDLKAWQTSKFRKPLIVIGARQVGKTYAISEFAKSNYKNVLYCNFESDKNLKKLFADSLEPKEILAALKKYFSVEIEPGDHTLIFFDEAQVCPEAVTSLKYFQELANEYHVICAGSLLGVALAQPTSYPVGKVDILKVFPLSFSEFCEALHKEALLGDIQFGRPIPELLHAELIKLLKLFFVVGGMPEAVNRYLQTNQFQDVQKVQADIQTLYQLDVAKHADPREIAYIYALWNKIPEQLSKENKKITVSTIGKARRFSEIENAVQWLLNAGISHQSMRISSPQLPLSAYAEQTKRKLYYLDVGLLTSFLQISPRAILDGDGLFQNYNGALTENFVAQELIASGVSQLYYWCSEGLAEVDFIVQLDGKPTPLEVKAGTSVKSRSLTEFGKRYPELPLFRASLLNFRDHGHISNIPLYAVGNLISRRGSR